ncbi:MAG: PD40 domain-containing protein [Gemmatimonadetes bacterium]|nr:PD40 domain-containing protein [Gemmatimonadota bacterium]MBI3504638.1 PD40 domain-containing protein [Pseudomonadota bacterium]
MRRRIAPLAAALLAAAALQAQTPIARQPDPGEERHLANIRQLTNGGTNAEAYFSKDGKWITFQGTPVANGHACDLQYVMRTDGTGLKRVSPLAGKTTCGWFLPDGKRLFFGSTHAADTACPPAPDYSKGYVWGIDPFDIFTVNRDGTGLKRLTHFNTYTAEGVLSPDGTRIVFTSLKGGDLDIYTMNVDGTDVRQLTNTPGYDGGPWWSPDGKKIVYRAYHPTDSTELKDYRDLLKQRMIRPNKMDLYIMNADGSDNHQITHLGGASFGPSWSHDGKRLIFSSNYRNPHSRNFDLFMVDLDGSNLEQITTNTEFDGFPMFSPDGKQVIWASNRLASKEHETNLFIADWKP